MASLSESKASPTSERDPAASSKTTPESSDHDSNASNKVPIFKDTVRFSLFCFPVLF